MVSLLNKSMLILPIIFKGFLLCYSSVKGFIFSYSYSSVSFCPPHAPKLADISVMTHVQMFLQTKLCDVLLCVYKCSCIYLCIL